ncbi:Uncharacterised protein [Raoultella planticola]|nr:Uncharacterised protein [Raoultella planticola]
MAKRMQDKESIAGMSWLVLLIIACWGGLVRYLIDVKQSKATWSFDQCSCPNGGFRVYRRYCWPGEH